MAIKIIGSTTGNGMEVDSNNNAKVNLPAVGNMTQAGYVVPVGESHDGATGASRILRACR